MAKILVFCVLFLFIWPPLNLDSLSTTKKLHHSPLSLSAHSSSIQYPDNKKFLLFIIDFDDFMCMNCLESFLSFCHSIPPHILDEIAWGILVLDQDNKNKQVKMTLKIAQKKLRGFINVHRIPFPILIDTHNMFHSSAREGTALLVFDNQERSISRCLFPLSKEESERIMTLLLKDNNH
jgi:hypothetical protein